ncbi:MAG: ribosomal protein L7/L12 [Pseudomonadota bacterium]
MSSEIVISDDELPPEVLAAIADGRKIVAIKLLREATGLGLANAKVLVDRAAVRMGAAQPRGLQEDSNSGKLLGLLLLAAAAFAYYKFLL